MAGKYGIITIALLAAFVAAFVPLGSFQAQIVLSIAVFVVILWISEVLPLHVTSLLVAILLVTLAGLPVREVFSNYFDPVVMLLLGGFVLACAMMKHGLDKYMAYKIMRRFSSRPRFILLGLILSTAFISMWISNTAAAAIMMPVAVAILVKNRMRPLKSRFGKAAVLGVAYGATIGGMGTVVGSTPNIIAAKYLSASGHFGFFEWFVRGFPFMLAMIVVGWIVLLVVFRPEKKFMRVDRMEHRLDRNRKTVLAIFFITVALWLTESIHGISNEIVAIVPIVLLYMTGMMKTEDFNNIDWNILILIGGGLALGYAIHAAGLDILFVSVLQGATLSSPLEVFLLLAILGVFLTAFVSNTTASVVYIPLVVALASSFGINPANTVVVAALGVSMDFIFHFGTPPSAIAYSTKYVRMKDMAKTGFVISLIGIFMLAIMATLW